MLEIDRAQSFVFKKANHSEALLLSLNHLRLEGSFTDFTLLVDNRGIQCHKVVLASLIPYFNSMFSSNMCEAHKSSATIKDVKMDIMQNIIEFAYTGEVHITEKNVEDLLKTASLFQMHTLRNACCKYLTQLLENTNCIGIYKFSEQYECSQLQDAAFRYMLHNFVSVSSSQEFLNLDRNTLITILSEDKLKRTSEVQVYEAVVRWAKHDLPRREPHLHQVMSCVRFGLMSRQNLTELYQGHETLTSIIQQLSARTYPLRHPSNQPRDPQRLSRRIYVAGGISSGVHSALSEVQCYNPESDSWETLARLTYPRFGAGLVARHGSLYMVGGHTGSSYITTVEKYDFEGNSWLTLPGLPGPTRRYFSTVGIDSKIMMIGGCDSVSYIDTAAVLDIPSKQLIHAGKMNDQRVYCGSCVLNDVVYVVGGYGLSRQYSRLKTAECYNQLTGSWHLTASMAVPRSGVGVVAIGGKMYAIGGFDGKLYLNSVEEYEPDLNEWRIIAPMTFKRCAHGCSAINGYIYVYGGFDGVNFVPSVERYDPYLKIWEKLTDMPSGKAYFGSTVL